MQVGRRKLTSLNPVRFDILGTSESKLWVSATDETQPPTNCINILESSPSTVAD